MAGAMAKDLKDLIPALDDQGIPNVVGSGNQGVSLQFLVFTMGSAPDTVVFADEGLVDMYDGNYAVVAQNQSDVADEATIGTKTGLSFIVTGPDASDVVDLIIVGRLKTQLA